MTRLIVIHEYRIHGLFQAYHLHVLNKNLQAAGSGSMVTEIKPTALLWVHFPMFEPQC